VSASAAFLLALAAQAHAGAAITGIAQIGPHYKVLTIEKSIHPQNQMVAYTKLDEDCRVLRDEKQSNKPLLDFYWLMDGVRYKRVHPLIKRGIRKRLEVEADTSPVTGANVFAARLNDLNEVENDLGNPLMTVRARKSAEGCEVQAEITLGPSDKNEAIRLDSIYSEAVITGGISAKVKSITLKGADLLTGRPVSRTYRAK
jgi:hypothetical protein